MKKKQVTEPSVAAHYNAVAENYGAQYDPDKLYDLTQEYPANYFRLKLLLKSFVSKKLKRVIEVGVGEGTPLGTLAKEGVEVWGFDIASEMVRKSKETMKRIGSDPERIFQADIQDPSSYNAYLGAQKFDGLMAMGVMPHVDDERTVLKNMVSMVRPGGSVFIEFRNKLFSLFTFNRYTAEFILEDLLKDVSPALKEVVAKELKTKVQMDQPPIRKTVPGSDAPGYDLIPAKFHNPFDVLDLFRDVGLKDPKWVWYHYHPAMPTLEAKVPELFRQEAIKLEGNSSSWLGLFLCSAFVVEAQTPG